MDYQKKLKKYLLVSRLGRGLGLLQRYLKTDILYLIRGGFWSSAAQVISVIAGFLTATAFANFISPETYGSYKYLMSIFGILSITTLGGMNTALIREVAQGRDGSAYAALREKIKWGLLGGLGAIILAWYYLYQGQQNLFWPLMAAGFFIPFMDAFNLFDSVLQGKKLFRLSAKYNSLIKIFATAIIIAVLFWNKKLTLIIIAYFASYTLLRLSALLLIKRKIKENNQVSRAAISYGRHLSFLNVLSTIAGQIDSIMLWHFLNAQSLAVYSFAQLPIRQATAFFKPLQQISIPKLAERDKEELKKSLLKKIGKSMLLLAVPAILLALALPLIYQLLFPQYLASVFYAQIFTLTIILLPERMLSMAMIAHASKKYLYLTNILNPLLRVVLVLILIPLYGIPGAIAAIIAQQIIFVFFDIYFFKKI